MFAQVIQAKTNDPDAVLERMGEWDRSVKPGAQGFLGSTAGVSDTGELIAIARFESEEAARRNSDRPEQSEWWAGMEKLLDGAARFYDSTEVEILFDGGSDAAGFVQVIQGRIRNADDKERWARMEAEAEGWMRENRPDLIGSVRVWQDLSFTDVIYFTSEEEARAGEKKMQESGGGEHPDGGDWAEQVDDLKFIDLRKPFFSSP